MDGESIACAVSWMFRAIKIGMLILVGLVVIMGYFVFSASSEKKDFESECIRLGYGGRDTDGNFVLKDGKNCTPE